MTIIDVEQNSAEWFATRAGLPTASVFATVMANGKDGGPSVGRAKLLHKLAFEIISGEPSPEGFQSAAMMRGNALEAEARESYARRKGVEVRRVGFVKNFEGLKACGCSPDGLVGFDGGLEVKTAEAHVLIPMLSRPALPPEHRAQVQGCIWVCERDWFDITIFCHRSMPAVDVRVYRDDLYIKELSDQVERFNFELRRVVESLRKMGAAG
ncbi:lambda exonuclease family protein [Bradyrhizobium sp.]